MHKSALVVGLATSAALSQGSPNLPPMESINAVMRFEAFDPLRQA